MELKAGTGWPWELVAKGTHRVYRLIFANMHLVYSPVSRELKAISSWLDNVDTYQTNTRKNS
jgi:hypothetical protein